ncbi:MAG: hypothetical protein QXM87_03625 [Candidatus Bathyarchaeia archaeon]
MALKQLTVIFFWNVGLKVSGGSEVANSHAWLMPPKLSSQETM